MLCLSLKGCKKSIMLKEKSCMCFVDIENVFDGVPKKALKWALRKKGIPEFFYLSVICLNEGAKTRVRVVRGV